MVHGPRPNASLGLLISIRNFRQNRVLYNSNNYNLGCKCILVFSRAIQEEYRFKNPSINYVRKERVVDFCVGVRVAGRV